MSESVVQAITDVANSLGIPPNVALAIANHESGMNPNAVGDNGTSFGLFQLHEGGELGNHSQAWAENAHNAAMTSLSVVAGVRRKHPDWSWGQVAAGAQRPANQGAYARAIDQALGSKVNYAQVGGGGGPAAGGGGGSAASIAATPPAQTYDAASLAEQFGYQAAFFNTDPSLKQWMEQALTGHFGDVSTSIGQSKATSALHETPWWQKHNAAQRQWGELAADDPKQAQTQLGNAITQVKQMAVQEGASLSPGAQTMIAYATVQQGLTPAQVKDAVDAQLKWTPGTPQTGATGAVQDKLASMAKSYGVPVSEGTLQKWAIDIERQRQSEETYQTSIKQQAANIYPGLKDQIANGQTVQSLADPYVQQEANLLEVNPDTIDFSKDPLVSKALQYKAPDSKPGEAPAVQPMYSFQQSVKNDPRWLKTNNARDAAMSTALQIGKDWGFVPGGGS